MFALYYEQENGRLTWIASCQDVRSARNVAQVYSTGAQRPVVCIYNAADGTTRRCCFFRDGQEINLDDPFENPDVETRQYDARDTIGRAQDEANMWNMARTTSRTIKTARISTKTSA
jgi:hypothetical protein